MKKYVFLTQSISGITGNQRYVNNKCRLLREEGWVVIVLWNYNVSPVQLEHVKCFDNEKYIHHELKFYSSWFSKKQRNKVIERLVSVIGYADQLVIESNKLELGSWGELLANRLSCKHINFVTSEGLSIKNKATFDYCYAKLLKNEFFNINPASVSKFFSHFVKIESPENYYWTASQGVEVEHYPFPAFDEMPPADYSITHFGRYKNYFPQMLSELYLFISDHFDKSFNIFFLGNSIDEDKVKSNLALPNVHLSFHPEVTIIPKQIFEKSDVIIATAGCASMATVHNPNVIAMDVVSYSPLGLLGRTTLDSNVFSGKYRNDKKTLVQWLESLLINGDQYPIIETRSFFHRFDYQMKFVDKCDHKYINTNKVKERMTRHDWLYEFMIKIGLFHVVEYFYFKKRGVKIIWR